MKEAGGFGSSDKQKFENAGLVSGSVGAEDQVNPCADAVSVKVFPVPDDVASQRFPLENQVASDIRDAHVGVL